MHPVDYTNWSVSRDYGGVVHSGTLVKHTARLDWWEIAWVCGSSTIVSIVDLCSSFYLLPPSVEVSPEDEFYKEILEMILDPRFMCHYI